jgi:hypothetical protein
MRNRTIVTPLGNTTSFVPPTPKRKNTRRKKKSKAGRPNKIPGEYAQPFGQKTCWSPKCTNPAKMYPITGRKHGKSALVFHPNYPNDTSKKICNSCYYRYRVTIYKHHLHLFFKFIYESKHIPKPNSKPILFLVQNSKNVTLCFFLQ